VAFRDRWGVVSEGNKLFISFVFMIVIARIWVFFTHMETPDIGSFNVHHYMIGMLLILAGIIISNVETYGLGLGLLLDEWDIFFPATFPVQGWDTYFSAPYLAGVLVCIVLVFLLRHKLARAAERTHTSDKKQ
jgi:hypothetical protein